MDSVEPPRSGDRERAEPGGPWLRFSRRSAVRSRCGRHDGRDRKPPCPASTELREARNGGLLGNLYGHRAVAPRPSYLLHDGKCLRTDATRLCAGAGTLGRAPGVHSLGCCHPEARGVATVVRRAAHLLPSPCDRLGRIRRGAVLGLLWLAVAYALLSQHDVSALLRTRKK